jgi:hypothetical protein
MIQTMKFPSSAFNVVFKPTKASEAPSLMNVWMSCDFIAFFKRTDATPKEKKKYKI